MLYIKRPGYVMATGAALCLMGALPAVAQDETLSRPPRAIVIRNDANGMTVPMYVGEELIIRLKSKPNTNNRWTWVETDPHILRRISLPSRKRPGAQNVQEFRLKAINPGRAVVILDYGNPQKSEALPEETYRLRVVAVPVPDKPESDQGALLMPRKSPSMFTELYGRYPVSPWDQNRFRGNRPPDGLNFAPPIGPSGILIGRF